MYKIKKLIESPKDITIQVKTFEELTIDNLYAILQLRSEVFVVEQDCIYQDIDGKDKKALHILVQKNNKIVGYARCFAPKDYFEEAAIGRVVIAKKERKFGYGHQLIEAAIQAIEKHYHTKNIRISAQQHLIAFYRSHAFQQTGMPYLEDGIPHINMIYSI